MTKTPQSGDAVSWKSHSGEAHGKVVKKITEPTQIKGHNVAASKDNPELTDEYVWQHNFPAGPFLWLDG